jgi:hypothetical protein
MPKQNITHIVARLKGMNIPEEVIGYTILSSVIDNKINHNVVYMKSNQINHFKNRECNAINTGLERILNTNIDNFNIDDRLSQKHKDELNSHLDIYHLHSIYDGVMYLTSRKESPEEIANILGKRALNVMSKKASYDSTKAAYITYLNNIRKAIADVYHIDLRE